MLQGRTKIQLFDAKTGQLVEENEEHNLITGSAEKFYAVAHLFRDRFKINNSPAFLWNSFTNVAKLGQYLYGSVYIYNDTLDEGLKFVNGDALDKFTARAYITNTGSLTKYEGIYLKDESTATNNLLTFSYFFGPQQANGQIGCIALGCASSFDHISDSSPYGISGNAAKYMMRVVFDAAIGTAQHSLVKLKDDAGKKHVCEVGVVDGVLKVIKDLGDLGSESGLADMQLTSSVTGVLPSVEPVSITEVDMSSDAKSIYGASICKFTSNGAILYIDVTPYNRNGVSYSASFDITNLASEVGISVSIVMSFLKRSGASEGDSGFSAQALDIRNQKLYETFQIFGEDRYLIVMDLSDNSYVLTNLTKIGFGATTFYFDSYGGSVFAYNNSLRRIINKDGTLSDKVVSIPFTEPLVYYDDDYDLYCGFLRLGLHTATTFTNGFRGNGAYLGFANALALNIGYLGTINNQATKLTKTSDKIMKVIYTLEEV